MISRAETGSERTIRPGGRPRLYLVLSVFLLLAWGYGQAVRDLNRITSLFFFIPSPICAGLLLLYSASAWKGRWRKISLCVGMAALVPGLFVLFVENRWTRRADAPPGEAATRVVHWNVGWGRAGWSNIYREIARRNPDFVLLSEVPDHMEERLMGDSVVQLTDRPDGVSNGESPSYTSLMIRPMVIMARGTLQNGRWLAQENAYKVYSVDWIFEGTRHEVFAVELDASLMVKRKECLDEVIRLIVREEPDMALGDFNAPRRSTTLTSLPAGYVHAYDAAGSGWSYTWPFPVFLYAIDQCIIGPRVKPRFYDLESTTASDHRIQVLDFTMASG